MLIIIWKTLCLNLGYKLIACVPEQTRNVLKTIYWCHILSCLIIYQL